MAAGARTRSTREAVTAATTLAERRGARIVELGDKAVALLERNRETYINQQVLLLTTTRAGGILGTQWAPFDTVMRNLLNPPIAGENLLPNIRTRAGTGFNAFLARVIAHNLKPGKTAGKAETRAALIAKFIVASGIDDATLSRIYGYNDYAPLKTAVATLRRAAISPSGSEVSDAGTGISPAGSSLASPADPAALLAGAIAGRLETLQERLARVRAGEHLERPAAPPPRASFAEVNTFRSTLRSPRAVDTDRIATNIFTDLVTGEKKGASGFVASCTQLQNGTHPRLSGLTPDQQFAVLDKLWDDLISGMRDQRSALYEKFKPEGAFTFMAPTVEFTSPRSGTLNTMQTSETFANGFQLITNRLRVLSSKSTDETTAAPGK